MAILKKYSAQELRKALSKEVEPLLTKYGFKKTIQGYRREYKDGVYGFITFLGSSGGVYNSICFNMYVGMAQKNVSRLINELMELPKTAAPFCIGWQGVIEIIQDAKFKDYEWRAETPKDITAFMPNISHIMSNNVLPFFEDNCCMPMYKYNIYSGRCAGLSWKDRVIPVLLYLDGDKGKGNDYIQRRIKESSNSAYQDSIDKIFIKNFISLPNP